MQLQSCCRGSVRVYLVRRSVQVNSKPFCCGVGCRRADLLGARWHLMLPALLGPGFAKRGELIWLLREVLLHWLDWLWAGQSLWDLLTCPGELFVLWALKPRQGGQHGSPASRAAGDRGCSSGFLCSSSITHGSSAYPRFVCFKNLSGSRWEGKPPLGLCCSPWAARASSSPGALGFSAWCREGFFAPAQCQLQPNPMGSASHIVTSPVWLLLRLKSPRGAPCTLHKPVGCLRDIGVPHQPCSKARTRGAGLGGTLLVPTPQFATRRCISAQPGAEGLWGSSLGAAAWSCPGSVQDLALTPVGAATLPVRLSAAKASEGCECSGELQGGTVAVDLLIKINVLADKDDSAPIAIISQDPARQRGVRSCFLSSGRPRPLRMGLAAQKGALGSRKKGAAVKKGVLQ